MQDLVTAYVHVPIGPMYGILGYHQVTVATQETLQTSKYGNVDINGYQVGLGVKGDHSRFQLTYSDFDDISITGTNSGETNQNKITADADALTASFSINF